MTSLDTLLRKAAKLRKEYSEYSPAEIQWAKNRAAVGMMGPQEITVLFEAIDALKAENKALRSRVSNATRD